MTLIYGCKKTYNHSLGLSVAFRQWRSDTHCRFLHGYALKVELVFEAKVLDVRNWVLDFGSLKTTKKWLEDTFDHKTLIASDDPLASHFERLRDAGGCDLVFVKDMGIEAFAKMIWDHTLEHLLDQDRIKLIQVTVSEHDGNSAYIREEKLSV